jgi:hypothetical protein
MTYYGTIVFGIVPILSSQEAFHFITKISKRIMQQRKRGKYCLMHLQACSSLREKVLVCNCVLGYAIKKVQLNLEYLEHNSYISDSKEVHTLLFFCQKCFVFAVPFRFFNLLSGKRLV